MIEFLAAVIFLFLMLYTSQILQYGLVLLFILKENWKKEKETRPCTSQRIQLHHTCISGISKHSRHSWHHPFLGSALKAPVRKDPFLPTPLSVCLDIVLLIITFLMWSQNLLCPGSPTCRFSSTSDTQLMSHVPKCEDSSQEPSVSSRGSLPQAPEAPPLLGFEALRFSNELRVDYFTTSVLCFDGSKQGDWQHTKGYLLVA